MLFWFIQRSKGKLTTLMWPGFYKDVHVWVNEIYNCMKEEHTKNHNNLATLIWPVSVKVHTNK